MKNIRYASYLQNVSNLEPNSLFLTLHTWKNCGKEDGLQRKENLAVSLMQRSAICILQADDCMWRVNCFMLS